MIEKIPAEPITNCSIVRREYLAQMSGTNVWQEDTIDGHRMQSGLARHESGEGVHKRDLGERSEKEAPRVMRYRIGCEKRATREMSLWVARYRAA